MSHDLTYAAIDVCFYIGSMNNARTLSTILFSQFGDVTLDYTGIHTHMDRLATRQNYSLETYAVILWLDSDLHQHSNVDSPRKYSSALVVCMFYFSIMSIVGLTTASFFKINLKEEEGNNLY